MSPTQMMDRILGILVRLFCRALIIMICCAGVSACSFPRGAALNSEILKEQNTESPDFQVVPVTQSTVSGVNGWPRARATKGAGWVSGKRGPDSQIIRSNDRVTVIIWDNEPNSLLTPMGQKSITIPDIVVTPTGTIFLPYVENVMIRGQTPDEARVTLQKALVVIAPSAQVQLNVHPGQGNAVDVVSGVTRPGTYPLPDRNTTILSIIAQAGGIAPGMRNPLVRLIRDEKTYEISAQRLLADASLNTTLRGHDKVLIEDDRRFFNALGATGAERIIPFDKESITALEAVSMSGGLNDGRANPKGVLILREYPASQLRKDGSGPTMQQVVFTFDLTSADGLFAAKSFQVSHGDTVLATESPVLGIWTILGLVGSVFNVANTANNISND